MRLDLGSRVRCTDGVFGELADVVVDPTTRRVTHLVVCPRHRPEDARLVPIARANPDAATSEVQLDATVEEIGRLEALRESAYLRIDEFPAQDPDWDVGIEESFALPYFTADDGFSGVPVESDPHVMVQYDRVPKGDVEIRRASTVTSADGHVVGHVDGLMVDLTHVTHVVLKHGHLWGKREVAIPIPDVAKVESDNVVLKLSRDAVGALSPVRVRRGRR
jgi:sporulation protein YlmC with PRC-barrel domain